MGHNSTQQYGTLYYVPYSTVHYVQYKHNCQGCLIENQTDCRRNQLKLSCQNLGKMSFQYKELWQLQLFYQILFLRSQFLLTLPIKIILPCFHCFWWRQFFHCSEYPKLTLKVESRVGIWNMVSNLRGAIILISNVINTVFKKCFQEGNFKKYCFTDFNYCGH